MRIAILLVVGFVLAAGCATNNGGNNGTTPTDNGAGGGNGTTAAKVVKTDTHDFFISDFSPDSIGLILLRRTRRMPSVISCPTSITRLRKSAFWLLAETSRARRSTAS